MNYPLISQILGRVLAIEGALMVIPIIVSLIYHESILPFVYTILIIIAISAVLLRFRPSSRDLYALEGFVVVALAWIMMSAVGAFPFMFSCEITNCIDAFL